MEAAKTYFEQIPIETVKTIAKEFPDKSGIGSLSETTKTQDEVRPPRERWREIAEKVQQECDPQKMIVLVQQLIETLDQEKSAKEPPDTPHARNRSGETEPGEA